MNYRIGLDIGITSVGWAVIENDEYGKAIKIVDLGARIFDAAETPKDGSSLALPRREARGSRRRNRRKVHRIFRTKELLKKYSIIDDDSLNKLYNKNNISNNNIYQLRVNGLDRVLVPSELSQILINFVKKRGYKSNSKAEELNDKKNGKAISAINKNYNILKEKGYRTVAEMYLKDDNFKIVFPDGRKLLKTRNNSEDYKNTVQRSMLLNEIKLILSFQSKYNSKITDSFISEYLNIFESQRSFDEGPGKPSSYGGSLIESMFGVCSFEENEKRAPKASYTFEMFKCLQDINHIKLEEISLLIGKSEMVYHKSDINVKKPISDENKNIILNEFNSSSELSYSKIRKVLNIPYDHIFNMIYYDFNNSNEKNIKEIIDKCEKEAKKLKEFDSFHKIRKALNRVENGYIFKLNEDELNKIGYILTAYKSDSKRIEEFYKIGLTKEAIDELITLSFSKVGHLSITAMKKIIPHLKDGLTYDKACDKVYPDFRGTTNINKKIRLSLKDIERISNPFVRRSVSQTIKVINAITIKYGNPDLVVIELARNLSRNFIERKQDTKLMENNMKYNDEIKLRIQNEYKNGLTVTGQDIVKYKLWQEQGEICPYSGKHINIDELFTSSVDIDHIVPYSISFNDSYNNKVLVKANENRQKGNKLPYKYTLDMNRDIEEYEVRIRNIYKGKLNKKVNILLKKEIENEEGMKDRNLSDTQYITKTIYNLIRNNLQFADSIYKEKPIKAVNGKITSHVSKMLGINKIREDGDKHHAIDAAIIANISESMIKKITEYYKIIENRYNDNLNKEEFNKNFPLPWTKFTDELKARCMTNQEDIENIIASLKLSYYLPGEKIKPIFVSKMPKRKITGPAHKETVRAITNDGRTITKTDIKKLKLDKDNEIENYYNKQDDLLLYNALKEKLIINNNNGELAFKETFYKPKSDGTIGPIVRKVKLLGNSTINVKLDKIKAVAANGDSVRVDVFYVKNEGYYFIPIYVSDTIKKELPNKASVAAKPYDKWKEMNDRDFIFSLYHNDLVYIKNKKSIKLTTMNKNSTLKDIVVDEMYGYYIGAGISSASISVSNNDSSYWQPSVGIKNLLEFKKYQVDILGNYNEIKLPEKRMKFNLKK